MFEVLFANWAPACRVLVENVSEWFTPVFIFYRCLVGFAVLNVLNAVFIQQTMKVAQQDQELTMKQQQRSAAAYAARLCELFRRLDISGDGYLSWDEFSSIIREPELQSWLSTLEIEHHDAESLFRMMDNGDGEISIDEFTAGASRLKGPAKNIDVACIQVMVKRLAYKVDDLISSFNREGRLEVKQNSHVVGLWQRMIT